MDRPVQLKRIWAVAVSSVLVQVLGQVDNLNGIERTFL